MKKLTSLLVVALLAISLNAQERIKLPEPMKAGGLPILNSVSHRQSVRTFNEGDISMQELSTILWAGFGLSHEGKRTAPTAVNAQDIELYVFLERGVYRWEAATNELTLIKKGDFRNTTDREGGFAAKVTNIAIVSDLSRYQKINDTHMRYTFGVMSSAYVSENMYLAVSGVFEHLGTVVRYAGNQERGVSQLLQLPDHKKLLLFQTIGRVDKRSK